MPSIGLVIINCLKEPFYLPYNAGLWPANPRILFVNRFPASPPFGHFVQVWLDHVVDEQFSLLASPDEFMFSDEMRKSKFAWCNDGLSECWHTL